MHTKSCTIAPLPHAYARLPSLVCPDDVAIREVRPGARITATTAQTHTHIRTHTHTHTHTYAHTHTHTLKFINMHTSNTDKHTYINSHTFFSFYNFVYSIKSKHNVNRESSSKGVDPSTI